MPATSLPAGAAGLLTLAVSPDGAQVLTCSDDRWPALRDAKTMTAVKVFAGVTGCRDPQFADAGHARVERVDGKEARVLDLAAGAHQARRPPTVAEVHVLRGHRAGRQVERDQRAEHGQPERREALLAHRGRATADHRDRHRAAVGEHGGDQLGAVHPRHLEIGDQQIGLVLRQVRQRRPGLHELGDRAPGGAEQAAQRAARVVVVIDQDYAQRRGHNVHRDRRCHKAVIPVG